MLNIYNQTLSKCPDNPKERNGSWMKDRTCTEAGGGVHQICYRDIGKNANKFSVHTGQSDWSTQRGNENHCVCLGAWSLYKKKLDEGIIETDHSRSRLKCDAIPVSVFSPKYVGKFSKWNGNEKKGQIVNGIEGIVTECDTPSIDAGQRDSLYRNYCSFAKSVPQLRETPLYIEKCVK